MNKSVPDVIEETKYALGKSINSLQGAYVSLAPIEEITARNKAVEALDRVLAELIDIERGYTNN